MSGSTPPPRPGTARRQQREHRKGRPLVLTDRDRALLHAVVSRRVMTLAQIHGRFWPEAAMATCQDRLRDLVRAGMLSHETTMARGRLEHIYLPTRMTRSLLKSFGAEEMASRRPPAASEMSHLLATGDVLDRLEERYGLLRFEDEHTLRAALAAHLGRGGQRGALPDLHVELAAPLLGRSSWDIEVDGAYFGQLLHHKVLRLAALGRPVLWVCFSGPRLARLQAAVASLPTLSPILLDRL